MRRTRRPRTLAFLFGAVLVVAVVIAVATSQAPGQDDASAPAAAAPSISPLPAVAAPSAAPGAGSETAMTLLSSVTVKGKSPLTGYSRVGDFGRAWLDVDHNGCDTRDDILARDLQNPVRSGPCKILTGVLNEPYTGRIIDFLRGVKTSALVQIDHLVPLANAWQTGAQQLTQLQREQLANDPLNLLAVDGSSNEQKSDGDAATWLPAQKSFRCTYVARQISVKAKYHLWVTPPERDAMVRVLTTCPGQLAVATG